MFSGRTSCLLILFLTLPLLARGDALSHSQISSFMASMSALQAEASFQEALAEGRQARELAGSVPGTMMVSDILVAFRSGEVEKDSAIQTRSSEIVQDHGFSALTEWMQTGDRILLALMNLQLGESGAQLLQELDRIEASVHANTYFSPDQQTRVLAMLAASRERIQVAMAVPEQDREAVRPFLAELQQVLDWQ